MTARRTPPRKRQRPIVFDFNGKQVRVPVSGAVFAYFDEQFAAKKAGRSRRNYRTVITIAREAYRHGLRTGRRQTARTP